jgi:hypothetical protein
MHRMKVMKSIKMKPLEVALLGLLLFRFVPQRLWRFVFQATQHFHGSSPSSKSLYRSPRKSESCLLQFMRWHARHTVLRLVCFPFSLVVGRTVFHE